jgi:hypothetical protein
MGAGEFTTVEAVQQADLTRFLDRLDDYQTRLAPLRGRLDGTPAALAEIQRFLPH